MVTARIWRRQGVAWLCLRIAAFVLIAAPSRLPAQTGLPQVVCRLDRPVIGRSQVDEATVFSDAPPGTALQYRWQAAGGGFVGADSARQASTQTATWDAANVPPGRYSLTVTVSDGARRLGSCSVLVMVANIAPAAPASLGRDAARDLLPAGHAERPQYGLYSYILLAGRSDETSRDRARAALQSYLQLEDVSLDSYFRPAELNITYVPVDSVRKDPDADWVLAHYDGARARALLTRAGIKGGDGPFIVSSLNPLGAPGSAGELIVQDLSAIPVETIPLWMKQFYSLTTQQHVWQKRSIGALALNLRVLINAATEGLPMPLTGAQDLITVRPGA